MDEEVIHKRSKLIDCLAVDDKINCMDIKVEENTLKIVVGCKNGDIVQWEYNTIDINERKLIKVRNGESICVNQLKFHISGLSLASCFTSKMVLIDSLTTMELFCFSRNFLTCIEWMLQNILIGDKSGKIFILDLKNGNVVYEIQSHGKFNYYNRYESIIETFYYLDSIDYMLSTASHEFNLIVAGMSHEKKFCIKVWKIDQID